MTNGHQALDGQPEFDIAIIGGGPTGLFGSFYAGLRGMKTLLIDALPELGGQLAVLYPEKYIYDVPGFPKILARDLVQRLVEQTMQYEPTVRLEEQVVNLEPLGERHLRVVTTRGAYHTRAVLIAAGVGAFAPNKLDAPGIARFEDRGVYYFVRSKAEFRDKRLLIVGGGDSAVDWALNLQDTAREITLIHRRDQFRAHEGSLHELSQSRVRVLTPWEIKEVYGEERVTGVTIVNNQSGAERELSVDAVLLQLGFKADMGPIKHWGLSIEKRSIKVDSRFATSMPGVYAAGDIAASDVKLDLIAVCFGQAAVAVNAIKTYVDPKARLFPGHSSDMSAAPRPAS
ncbi:NAD(P)/FAD-dependent oxidoreductase [Kallotenue papyrolyticum]|uniref:NAD(P)/FAD-dependent oxidoreductase n=1 Tax=Kallotenue papyrolyticum TaxID=1325125 RepID=UPI00047864E0|nr:NAD(P)/FAD-dependent oxidoreductase [Kallotenue papyrolyticum]